MKSTVWVLMLSAITFGIGWTSSKIAGEVPSTPGSEVGPRKGEPSFFRGSRGDGGRGGSRFPFAGSADEFAEKLQLDSTQQERLAGLLAESARRIREHEESIFTIKSETRSGMLELLTDTQRVRLDELFAARIRKHSEENIAAAAAWFRENVPSVNAEVLSGVESALADYEAGKGQYMSREYCGDRAEGDVDRVSVEDLRARRDERLSALVGADVLERYLSARPSRWKGGRPSAPKVDEGSDAENHRE